MLRIGSFFKYRSIIRLLCALLSLSRITYINLVKKYLNYVGTFIGLFYYSDLLRIIKIVRKLMYFR